MNLFQLVLKQMRQRALSTWLTLLSVMLGVALAVAILLVQRGGRALFGQTDYGYDLIVGAKGSPLQLVLNTVYHIDRSPGNIPYSLYEQLNQPRHPQVRLAVPFAVGDTYKGQRIVGTQLKLFGIADDGQPMERPFEYRPGRRFEIAEGQGGVPPGEVRGGHRLGDHAPHRAEARRQVPGDARHAQAGAGGGRSRRAVGGRRRARADAHGQRPRDLHPAHRASTRSTNTRTRWKRRPR